MMRAQLKLTEIATREQTMTQHYMQVRFYLRYYLQSHRADIQSYLVLSNLS